jgi:hypothetical protein
VLLAGEVIEDDLGRPQPDREPPGAADVLHRPCFHGDLERRLLAGVMIPHATRTRSVTCPISADSAVADRASIECLRHQW